ncbi:ventricular zone-expressed PH domain-containing protein homolog 1 isoform X2 [Aplysia californica]|uniref:Ventricular zone-expressed PH domain-containing protein homolog 1 isoform X2 n=1 Tax=Aplysia californica TaxID=6500 RepID=A0ABM0JHV8_APLCA|nr:ventricular zone-expressed PH domain-containing protein homolog 1 isoform X2 [Aplysia californica]
METAHEGKKMNKLFAEVLAKKDLSKAGELFSLSDDLIEKDLEKIVEEIIVIADSDEYEKSDNDQSVVEICITRITTAIRETENICKHAEPLVRLLSVCHKHNLSQVAKDEDPPHAKIASDIMSRLFTYYSNKHVMTLTIPAVVQFLDCDNKDLVRSVASYLSLATIDNADLLAHHMTLVLSTVLKGNYLLGQVLPQIYDQNPGPVLERVEELAELLERCDTTEKVCFVQLFSKVAKTHPKLLEPYVPQLCSYLPSSLLSSMVLMILVDLALAQPASVGGQVAQVQAVVGTQPMLMYQVALITGAVGTLSQEEGRKSMEYLVSRLSGMDQSILPSVLQEIRGLGQAHPALLAEYVDQISRLSTSGSSAVRLMVQQIREDVRKNNSPSSPSVVQEESPPRHKSPSPFARSEEEEAAGVSTEQAPAKQTRSVSSQTEGTVTIITVGNPPNATHPSGTVSVKSTALAPSGGSSQQSLVKLSHLSSDQAYGGAQEVTSHTTIGTSTDLSPQGQTVRDGVQLFCEKHFAKIKNFISKLNATIPLPAKCSVVNGKHKRYLKLHFECGHQSDQCLYSGSHFTLNTRLPKLWLHLMFLSVQAQSRFALSQRDSNVSSLKTCWDALKGETTSNFLTLVTSSFPTQKDQLGLLQELHQMRYFDVFELNAAVAHWACFLCNHPEKLSELLNDGYPEIAGQLKEKKGKWKFFKRWKTRYFTLSGGSITYDKSNATKASLPVTKIQSVKAIRKGIRDIPKAFEIFTEDQTYMFKAKGHHNVEQWVQCLHIAVARSQIGGSTSSSLMGGASPFTVEEGEGDSHHAGGKSCLVGRPEGAANNGAGVWGTKVKHSRGASFSAGGGVSSSRMVAHPGLFEPQHSHHGLGGKDTRKIVTDTKL